MKFSELDTQPKMPPCALIISSICRFVLQLAPQEATQVLEPVFAAAAKYPEEAAKFMRWLILGQGDRRLAPTLWALWQRFADDRIGDPRAIEPERAIGIWGSGDRSRWRSLQNDAQLGTGCSLAQLAREKIKRLDEARSLIRQLFRTEVDLIPDQQNNTLTVRLHP